MKKILFTLFIGVSFIGCSNNDDDNTVQQTNPVSNSKFHCPAWIQGNWKLGNTVFFKFKTDDFLSGPYNFTSYKEVLQQASNTGQAAKVDETISETDYNFVITAGSSSGEYRFRKISTTRIQWVNNTTSPQPVYLDKE